MSSSTRASPREVASLGQSLEHVPKIKAILEEGDDPSIQWLRESIKDCRNTVACIKKAVVDDPASSPGEGGVIKEGFSQELDELRNTSREATDYIASLEKRERDRTGIRSLKVGYNRVFGYYIEVSKTHLKRVPQDYVRRQTLVGG